jgi:EAL domain-containing protein (putative c-di-GMP-specific phosphodiesterase class I)/DNA-binding NarL/FixJ family response regulator
MSVIRVLVVDDQDDVRRAVSLVIKAEPSLALVGAAPDLESGLALAVRERPDVALVDFKLSGGGPRLVREICLRCPSTRVLAFSAYEDRAAVFEMLRAGASGYLVKGEEIAGIGRAIRRVAAGESTLSPSVMSEVLQEFSVHLEHAKMSEDKHGVSVARVRETIQAGGISTVYQPIVELRGRRTIGYEALSRFMTQPARTPDVWFAEAASVGLGVELERAAIASALAGLSRIQRDCFLSVNLSPWALLDAQVLDELGARDARRTVVELTEHAPVDDYTLLQKSLLDLRARGLRLAVDDAGAGYASLRHVLNLAPDMIKIDISLTREIETSRGARALAAALISFGAEMGQLVIAEGIEGDETIDVLEGIGVQYGQGFLLGEPSQLRE